MKTTLKTLSIVMLAMVLAFASGCKKSSASDDNTPNNGGSGGGNNGGGNNGGGGTTSIPTLIAQNVHATASCYRSDITLKISSTLENALPGKTIKYGVEYGYLHDYEWENDDYNLDCDVILTKTGGVYKSTFSFFIQTANNYEWPCGFQGAYYQSIYDYYTDRIQNGYTLDDEDWEVYNDSKDLLRGFTRDATQAFCGLVYVKVNNSKYYFKRLTTYGSFNNVSVFLNSYPQ